MADTEYYKGKILIVDDTPLNINLLLDTLEEENYKIFVANDGESALERAPQIQPDLVLLDVMMPGINGFETCRRMKQDERLKKIPVIFMTALSETSEKVKGFDAGGVDYITKPFQTPEVLARVDTQLTMTGLRNELEKTNAHLEALVKERTRELEDAKNKAEKSDRLKSEFLSQISHEIRTPINAILSFANLIEAYVDEDRQEEVQETLSIIDRGGNRLVRTFDLLLHMSQVQSGNYEIEKEEFPLVEDFLTEIFTRYRNKALEKKLRYTLINKAENDLIYVDKEMTELMLDNIIMNAVEFTYRGKISITVYNDENGAVCVRVEDTGIGISKDFIPEIFELFTQEDQGLGRKYEGNGLGLALTKKYAELNDSEILMESEKGAGSVFSVRFNNSRKAREKSKS